MRELCQGPTFSRWWRNLRTSPGARLLSPGYNVQVRAVSRRLIRKFSREFAEAHSVETAPARLAELLSAGCHGLVVIAAYVNPSTPRAAIAMFQLAADDRNYLEAWEAMAGDLPSVFEGQVRVIFEHMQEWYFLDAECFGFR